MTRTTYSETPHDLKAFDTRGWLISKSWWSNPPDPQSPSQFTRRNDCWIVRTLSDCFSEHAQRKTHGRCSMTLCPPLCSMKPAVISLDANSTLVLHLQCWWHHWLGIEQDDAAKCQYGVQSLTGWQWEEHAPSRRSWHRLKCFLTTILISVNDHLPNQVSWNLKIT